LAIVAQLYSSLYYAVFFVVYAAVVGLALLRVHRRSIRQVAMPLAAAGLMGLLMALPLIQVFIAAKPMKGERGDIEVATYSAVPGDYLRVHQYAALWRGLLPPRAPERALFPGAAPLVLAATALVPPLGTMRLAYAAGLLVAFDGSLGLHGVVYPMLYRLPGPIREIRAPARFAALVGLTLSILAAFGVRRVVERPGSPAYRHAMFAGLIALIMVDAWPALTVEPVWKEPPPIYETLKYTPKAVIAELPMRDDEVGNLPYMYFSIWHWAQLVNGYSGFIPQSYADFHSRMLLFPDDTSIAELRRRGVTYVSLNCGLGYGRCDELADAMRRSKALRPTAEGRWMGQPVQLYEVVPP
jgi:hypothetical protein